MFQWQEETTTRLGNIIINFFKNSQIIYNKKNEKKHIVYFTFSNNLQKNKNEKKILSIFYGLDTFCYDTIKKRIKLFINNTTIDTWMLLFFKSVIFKNEEKSLVLSV